MQDHKSLTLRWRSFSWCGREHASLSLAFKGGQYSIDDSLQPFTTLITRDAKPNIVDASLTLIFMMGQGACRFILVLQRRPILHLWQPATIHNSDYRWCNTKNRWHSIDVHFNVLSSQNLLTAIIVFKIISAYLLPVRLIYEWPHGEARHRNILAWVNLIILKFIYHAEMCILPAVLHKYLHATAYYSPNIFL